MDEVARLLTLLALAGGALTLVGGAFAWFLDEARRIRRSLAKVLGAEPKPMLAARGRGLGIGFDLPRGRLAVAWDKGAWCLIYRVEELVGVEMIVDRQVAARTFRGESRRPLDRLGDPEDHVRLRFIFDDTAYPDFEIDIWRPEDEGRSGRLNAGAALREANRWMARMESLLRRPIPLRATTVPAPAAEPIVAATAAPPWSGPLFDPEDDDDEPPWDDDLEDDARVIN